MKRTFTYKEKFTLSYFYPAGAFIILSVIIYLSKYGIALKSLTLLTYPNSLYIFVGLSVLSATYGVMKVQKALASRKNPNPIVLDDTSLSFPIGAEGKVEISIDDITGISTREESGGRTLIVNTKKNGYEFEDANFETFHSFNEFRDALNSHISK